jgi:uncharacterized membrane protein
MGIFLSFLPWIVFWILSGRVNYQTAAILATVVVIILNFRNIKHRNLKILDLGTLIFFIILTGISFVSKAVWVDHYSAPLSSVAMFIIASVSLAIGKPFTIQYAYEQVDPQFWKTRSFYTTNRTITAVWCIVFAINALLSYLYLETHSRFYWIIELIIIAGVVKFTTWYPDFVKTKNQKTDDKSGQEKNEEA